MSDAENIKVELVEKNDDSATERRIKYIELSIVTITALLALIAFDQPKQIIISVLILLLSIGVSLVSFIFDPFIEQMEITTRGNSTVIKSQMFNVWDWIYFISYGLALLYFSCIVIRQYLI